MNSDFKETKDHYDLIVIGAGPAGLQAGLQAEKLLISTLVIGHPNESNAYRSKMWNYVGLIRAHGKDICDTGAAQIEEYCEHTELLRENVLSVEQEDDTGRFRVATNLGRSISSSYLMIATGAPRKLLKISVPEELIGHGVSYCTECDSYMFQKKRVLLVGYSYDIFSKLSLLNNCSQIVWAPQVPPMILQKRQEQIDRIKQFLGEKLEIVFGFLQQITKTENGIQTIIDLYTTEVDGIFIELGGAEDIGEVFRNLNLSSEKNRILVDQDYRTSNKRVFAVGDCIGGVLQLPTAVGEACTAATIIAKEVIEAQVTEAGKPRRFNLNNGPADF